MSPNGDAELCDTNRWHTRMNAFHARLDHEPPAKPERLCRTCQQRSRNGLCCQHRV